MLSISDLLIVCSRRADAVPTSWITTYTPRPFMMAEVWMQPSGSSEPTSCLRNTFGTIHCSAGTCSEVPCVLSILFAFASLQDVPLEVVCKDGFLWSLNNRRLYVFRVAHAFGCCSVCPCYITPRDLPSTNTVTHRWTDSYHLKWWLVVPLNCRELHYPLSTVYDSN